ncbi:MAG: Fic family protein [Desulfitobacteriaceae bacterium]
MDNEILIWKPLELKERWLEVSTAKLDNILPSWLNKRERLKKDNKEYEKFLNRLKRQHAIETGIIEKLYDLKDGITETFIKEGFVESYLQHGDTNVSPKRLMSYLHDHFEAIDFTFDLVKSNREITKSFILELHQLITSHQETTNAIDSLVNIVQVSLKKGQFKIHDNNPRREDGTIFLYCPPVQVESEMDKLLSIFHYLENNKIHPIIIAAWFHHGFVQIHPFQDGNGRIARLLASLILIKNDLFPFTVKRDEKKQYIDSLELADKDNYQPLINFFCQNQVRNIEHALNVKTDLVSGSFSQVMDHFTEKVLNLKVKAEQEREVY